HLKAQPSAGHAFQGWQGGCGTQTDCTFPVGPITAVKAAFAVNVPKPTLKASLLSVKVKGTRATRRVTAKLKCSVAATMKLRLETIGGKKLATRTLSRGAGTWTVSVGVPRATKPGRYRLRVTVVAAAQTKKLAHVVKVGR